MMQIMDNKARKRYPKLETLGPHMSNAPRLTRSFRQEEDNGEL